MKFSCQYFDLKLVACCKTHKYTSSSALVGLWVLTGRKVILTAKKNESLCFCPFWTPHQNEFQFFDHHCKGKVFTEFFYAESLFPTCLVRALWLFEWTQLVFPAYAKTGFPLKRCHNDVTGARSPLQKMPCCLPDPMMASLTLYLSGFQPSSCSDPFVYPVQRKDPFRNFPVRHMKYTCVYIRENQKD